MKTRLPGETFGMLLAMLLFSTGAAMAPPCGASPPRLVNLPRESGVAREPGVPGQTGQQQSQAPVTPPQLGGSKPAQAGGSAPASKPTGAQGNADAPENDPNLNLTTDQLAKIKAIRDDAEVQVQAAEKDTTLTTEQKERRIKGIRKTTRAQVFAVLTPEQQKTWSAEQREKREAKKPAAKAE